MPTFDPEQKRICVRIVYDGAAGGGKTTNLQQLCSLFATQQGTDLYTPLALRGRTLYFDWVQIRAGVACGYPLVCQVVAVPGQVVLTPRRHHLLSSADVVVYVCDSARSLVSRLQAGFSLLAQVEAERPTPMPILVQANKQDQVDALSGAEVLAALGRELPVVEAIAADGVGVVDTFVKAVGAAVSALSAQAERGALRLEVRPLDTPERLLARLSAQAIDPAWAAEMLLEEASDAFLLERARTYDRERSGVQPVRGRRADEPSPPTAEVPTGFVWPGQSGRALLKALTASKPATTPEVDARTGSIRQLRGEHELTTSTSLRFESAEAAQRALVGAARAHTQLEALLTPDTVLVVQESADGSYWLWRVAPHVTSLAELLQKRALAAGEIYAEAAVLTLRIALRHGLALSPGLAALGLQRGVPRYLAMLDEGPLATRIRAGLRSGLEALCAAGIDPARFSETLLYEARRQLDLEQLRRAGLPRLAELWRQNRLDVGALREAVAEEAPVPRRVAPP